MEEQTSQVDINAGNVTIGEGELAGKGVYAARDFRAGEIVIQYHLRPLTQEEYDALSESESMFIHEQHGVVHLYSEPERYVNHSDTPNTYQDHERHTDVALRDIRQGEMITTDATKDDVS